MSKFQKYKLTEKQIKGIACIVAYEQKRWEEEQAKNENKTDRE